MVLDLARLPEALRDHGLRVKTTEGWLTRGYDDVDFVGQLSHHTGGSGPLGTTTRDFVIRGRVGSNEPNPLPGPLCNLLEGVESDGVYTVYLIAGRRARHAGPGSPVVYGEYLRDVHVEATALARGLEDDENTHGNRSLLGREVHHPGTGPWSEVILAGLGRSSAAVAELAGWSASRHKGHKHWTRRKPDPSWSGSLPALTADYLGDDDMPITDADVEKIANRVTEKLGIDTTHAYTVASTRTALTKRLDAVAADVDAVKAAIGAGGVDPQVITDAVERGVLAALKRAGNAG